MITYKFTGGDVDTSPCILGGEGLDIQCPLTLRIPSSVAKAEGLDSLQHRIIQALEKMVAELNGA